MLWHPFASLHFRPPDRRRRDVFGVANNTLFNEGVGTGNTTLGPGDNSTDAIPPIKEYPFSEDKSITEYLEILNLRPFTVYRIDIHACNEEVGRCSAGTFVFSRTKPAGDQDAISTGLVEWYNIRPFFKSVLFKLLLKCYNCALCVFLSQSRWHPWWSGLWKEWQSWGLCGAALARTHNAQWTHPNVWDQISSGDWGEPRWVDVVEFASSFCNNNGNNNMSSACSLIKLN